MVLKGLGGDGDHAVERRGEGKKRKMGSERLNVRREMGGENIQHGME